MAPLPRMAPTMVWNSSTNRMALPSRTSSSRRVLNRSSKSPRYLVPATRLAISSASSRRPCSIRGHIPAGDALGKALGKGRFAHARLPHQTGVILLAAAQDLHHPVQLRIPAEHRVQLAVHQRGGSGRGNTYRWRGCPGHGAGQGVPGRMNCPRAGGTPARPQPAAPPWRPAAPPPRSRYPPAWRRAGAPALPWAGGRSVPR